MRATRLWGCSDLERDVGLGLAQWVLESLCPRDVSQQTSKY